MASSSGIIDPGIIFHFSPYWTYVWNFPFPELFVSYLLLQLLVWEIMLRRLFKKEVLNFRYLSKISLSL